MGPASPDFMIIGLGIMKFGSWCW